jgi:hypothetical protein
MAKQFFFFSLFFRSVACCDVWNRTFAQNVPKICKKNSEKHDIAGFTDVISVEYYPVGSSNSLILIFYSCRIQCQTIWFRFRINLIDCCENNQYNYKRLLLISPGGRKDRPTTLLMILNYNFLVKSIC